MYSINCVGLKKNTIIRLIVFNCLYIKNNVVKKSDIIQHVREEATLNECLLSINDRDIINAISWLKYKKFIVRRDCFEDMRTASFQAVICSNNEKQVEDIINLSQLKKYKTRRS